MAKNKDINISPSKGISIVIKNDIVQPLPPIKPKKKRKYRRINVLPKTPAPQIMQQSAGDTSYIKDQPGRFSLWRDTTTSTPVLTLAQATSQGFIPNMQLPAPPPQQALPPPPPPPQPPQPPPPQQQLLMPPPFAVNFTDYMRAMMPQEFGGKQVPRIEDLTDMSDPFYNALPPDKKEAYKDTKLEEVSKDIDDTAAKAVADAENTDFYKNELTPDVQNITKEKTKYITIQKKLEGMKEGSIKSIATRDINSLNEPRYPQNKIYRESYKKGLKNQEETINKRIQELDDIISTKTGTKKTRAETEKLTKSNDLKKIEDLYKKMESEKKRIKDLLK
jgi:hypothetical protein